MMYTLYNRRNNKIFSHPKIGIWLTEKREEADILLKELKEILVECSLPEIASSIEVRTIRET